MLDYPVDRAHQEPKSKMSEKMVGMEVKSSEMCQVGKGYYVLDLMMEGWKFNHLPGGRDAPDGRTRIS